MNSKQAKPAYFEQLKFVVIAVNAVATEKVSTFPASKDFVAHNTICSRRSY